MGPTQKYSKVMDPTQKYSKGMDTKAKTPKTPKKPIYNGTGSWDLGVGTWDLGPRTWDMGAGDGTWDFGSRHGRSTVLSTAPCPGAGRMICLFLFMVPKPKYSNVMDPTQKHSKVMGPTQNYPSEVSQPFIKVKGLGAHRGCTMADGAQEEEHILIQYCWTPILSNTVSVSKPDMKVMGRGSYRGCGSTDM